MTDKTGDRIALIVQQTELTGAQTDGGVNHFFTWPGHQIEHHQLVFIALWHVVDNLTHIKKSQVVGHVFSQFEPGDNLAMNLVATAAADAVVGMVFEDLFPHFFQQTVVILKTQRPGERRQRLKDVDDFILNAGVGNFDIHARGANCPVHTHVFAVDKLPFQRRQFITVRINVPEHLLEPAHYKFTLRVNFTKLIHHRENVLLQRHLVMPVGQQNLFGHRGVFQHLKVIVESFT